MINVDDFYIDIEEFYQLPKPTPKGYDRVPLSKEQEKFNAKVLGYENLDLYKKENSSVKLLKRYSTENPNDFVTGSIGYSKMLWAKGIIMLEKDFKFSKESIQANEKKEPSINRDDSVQEEEYGSSYEKYNGYNDYSDDVIDDAFEGDPSATWNVD
jgi:hypothetical protein